jgi:hypothetical protein
MKVKHKQSGVELAVKEEQAPFKAYWTTDGGSYIHKQDPEWELVKEEEWKDVTDECEAGRYSSTETATVANYIWVVDNSNKQLNALFVDGYRLRKIDGMHYGPAFIIERRKA